MKSCLVSLTISTVCCNIFESLIRDELVTYLLDNIQAVEGQPAWLGVQKILYNKLIGILCVISVLDGSDVVAPYL
jgi:hypothetical protein